MDENIISAVSSALSITSGAVKATLALLEDGATIPFIARYRKEATGSLDEVAIESISRKAEEFKALYKRKEYVLEVIGATGGLTDELKQRIASTMDASDLEDIFAPYKPKRRTKAAVAREKGLESLAASIMAMRVDNPEMIARKYISKDVPSVADAIAGASDIIAEWVSDNAGVRGSLRRRFRKYAVIESSIVKGKEEEAGNYSNYAKFSRKLSDIPSHNYLALRRGEREGLLKVSVAVDNEKAIDEICARTIRPYATEGCADIVRAAIRDGYRRLLKPAIETEISAEVKEMADKAAISMFSDNLSQLLLGAPLAGKRVMAIDPGFRTGCKVVCLDEQGNLLHNDVIYPVPPRQDIKGSASKIHNFIEVYKIDAIALGNGTASRETEQFLQSLRFRRNVDVFIVNESGASIYSASPLARSEFPDKDVTVRGAVSIGRRLIDPLAELVKIDPQSIGVGQYQHDVDQGELKASLDFTVMSCVNMVGVNLNTASPQLLSYVSGLGPAMAAKIVGYRSENGNFDSRESLKRVPRLGAKTYEQCAGFLRIPESSNPLDNTAVHPENYSVVQEMARDLGISVAELCGNKSLLSKIDIERYVKDGRGLPTLKDIITELEKPGRDPRTSAAVFEFDSRVKEIGDLSIGMMLPGIVNNITAFGAFVDIGIKESGLIHISQLCDRFIASPLDAVKLNQHVTVKVIDVDMDRRRISLSMKGVPQ
ncbi:MAG TPA: Tex family protein [Muribaculaceae bacterium]|nr:Tex family protein [Muribaculaceae bacterium]